MKNDFILIYKSNGFAESKETEFELRNAFKKYELHASYMTKRKFKTMAKVDPIYKSLQDIHHTLSHAAFVIFVHPTEECKYKQPDQIVELINLLKKENTIQNDDTYFVSLVINGTCISLENLEKIYAFKQEMKEEPIQNWMVNTLNNPISIINYNLNNCIASYTNKNEYAIRTNVMNAITTKYIYI